jgi:hypothetical protein
VKFSVVKFEFVFFIFIAALGVGSRTEACLEKPKSLKLSETTFENDVEISYGVNCQVSLMLDAKNGVSYHFAEGFKDSQYDKLCLTITKDRDYQNKKEYCGEDLTKLSAKDKNALTLRNKAGEAVGALDISDNTIRILSWNSGGAPGKPHLEFQIEDLEKSWSVRAMQSETIQVGGGSLKSGACSRSIGDKNSGQALDLRGKQISTSGAGCSSGLVATDFGSSAKTPVFKMEGASGTTR